MLRAFSLFLIFLVTACSFNYDYFTEDYLEVRYEISSSNKYYFKFKIEDTSNVIMKRFIVLDDDRIYKVPLDISKKENSVNILFIDKEYNLDCNSSLEDKDLNLYYNCR